MQQKQESTEQCSPLNPSDEAASNSEGNLRQSRVFSSAGGLNSKAKKAIKIKVSNPTVLMKVGAIKNRTSIAPQKELSVSQVPQEKMTGSIFNKQYSYRKQSGIVGNLSGLGSAV
jgi:hypothetical protein